MARYRRKTQIIDAIQYNGCNAQEVHDFLGITEGLAPHHPNSPLKIRFASGIVHVDPFDYIIKGDGMPISPDYFTSIYEEIEANPPPPLFEDAHYLTGKPYGLCKCYQHKRNGKTMEWEQAKNADQFFAGRYYLIKLHNPNYPDISNGRLHIVRYSEKDKFEFCGGFDAPNIYRGFLYYAEITNPYDFEDK